LTLTLESRGSVLQLRFQRRPRRREEEGEEGPGGRGRGGRTRRRVLLLEREEEVRSRCLLKVWKWRLPLFAPSRRRDRPARARNRGEGRQSRGMSRRNQHHSKDQQLTGRRTERSRVRFEAVVTCIPSFAAKEVVDVANVMYQDIAMGQASCSSKRRSSERVRLEWAKGARSGQTVEEEGKGEFRREK
jgi:hypothetical protein